MKDSIYVVSLVGKDVYQDGIIYCCIMDINNLDDVRDIIKSQYNIEFEDSSSYNDYSYLKFDNITDNRDIRLVVERTRILT